MSLQGQWGDREHGHLEQCTCCATVCCAVPHGPGSAHLRNTGGSSVGHSRSSSCRRDTRLCRSYRRDVSAGGGAAAPGPAAFAFARRGPATLGAEIRWPPATALPRSPASRERAGLQAAGLLQEPWERPSHQLMLGHRSQSPTWNCADTGACTGQNGCRTPPSAPKPCGCAAPGPGMPRGSPCALLSPQYTSQQLPAGTVGATVPGGCQVPPCALQMVLPGWLGSGTEVFDRLCQQDPCHVRGDGAE